ncbi:hypothetical protein Misp02_70740 [Microtetraspora sp. NBRC 16547]|nr:hypothetical protein Misp02_70740 [Microtetraspora sp. NBRC 16547]
MAEVVKTHGPETGRLANLAPATTEVVRLHRCSAPRREDEAVILPVRPPVGPLGELALAVLLERLDAYGRKRDGTLRVFRLGLDELKPTSDPLKGLDDFQRARLQVDVFPTKPDSGRRRATVERRSQDTGPSWDSRRA